MSADDVEQAGPDGFHVQIHEPLVVTDGGPWAEHDYACPTCQVRKAVLFLNTGQFHPCDQCRSEGWELRKRRRGHGRIR